MSVCERENVCVCVRERDGESVNECVRESVCVCVRERGGESVNECVCEREGECE